MSQFPIKKRHISNSPIVLGCMGFGGERGTDHYSQDDIYKMEIAIDAALSSGITMFDHADIYRNGKAEKVFGEVLKANPSLRNKIVIQSKCGIRFPDDLGPKRYDFSKEYIIQSVDNILQRLTIDSIDVLLLHRPDPLIEPEEVAEAFEWLKSSGKVQHFGVSNMNKSQMELMNAYLEDPLIVNQLEMSLRKLDWVNEGISVNQQIGLNNYFADGLLEYSKLIDVQIQAWGSLANGIYSGRGQANVSKTEKNTIQLVNKLAEEKNTSPEAIVIGWLMRHPVKVQPVIGTTNPERIQKCADGVQQSKLMTREEWYELYVTSRGDELP
ncbi:aldo/keto reductase [Bacillus carboniphilus]|uniref:Aldo/keto reductase n=1 Tax=Bacillus carboniphilus TaxID=86663 RepID=A0ABY9JVK3_9BACI|nr:aldo/keto reductase [Bacillus carboniphilus]WLR42450.1 aldo/keto reductase [Bacillus carboniphilus]